MIHTFSVATNISPESARRIFNALGVNGKRFDGDPGILGFSNIKLRQVDPRISDTYRLAIVVNPAQLLTDDYTAFQTVTEEELPCITVAFADKLEMELDYSTALTLPEWPVVRVDYSFDLFTSDVATYIDLFQRGDMPYRFRNYTHNAAGSLYIGCESTKLNFYDKTAQLANANADAQTIAMAAHTLRLEVQCKSRKVGAIKSRDELEDRQLRRFFNLNYAMEQVRTYCHRVLRDGDYFTFEEAEAQLIAAGTSSRMLTALTDTLRAINQARSIHAAKARIEEGIQLNSPNKLVKCSRQTFMRHLKELGERGVNPITIPRRWGEKTLPGALTLLAQLWTGARAPRWEWVPVDTQEPIE